jgi:hypothetical protein
LVQADPKNVDVVDSTTSTSPAAADVPSEADTSVGFPQDPSTTIEPQPLGPSAGPASKSIDLKLDDTQVPGDGMNDTEMSPPPLTTTVEITAPDWLKRMLDYLRGVSDSTYWQDLVSALLRFENMNPPSGVGTSFIDELSSNLISFSF